MNDQVETRTLPKTRGRHPPPKRMATALVRDERDVDGSRSSAGELATQIHTWRVRRSRAGSRRHEAPRIRTYRDTRVNKYDHPSLAASDGLRTYLLPQASRCRERWAG